jgi:Glycosyl transferase family 2
MHNCFLSVVGVVNTFEEIDKLPEYLQNLHGLLENNFSDYEIILVNNTQGRNFDQKIVPLKPALKQNIYLLNLSSVINKNHAIIAGLDRANGDYTVLFELDFFRQPELVLALFDESCNGFDIVYLRAKEIVIKIRFRLLYNLFYYILKHYSNLKIDEKAHDTRIISRRALNSLLRLRENLRYMKAIYSIVGYQTSFLEVDKPLDANPLPAKFSEKFRTSLVAITSFTTFLRTMLLWIFIFSFIFLVVVIFNAVKVKLTKVDIFGGYHEAISGWTFLVVLISIFFALTFLNLYIISIYLSNIYNEIKQRPLYIIESVKRF